MIRPPGRSRRSPNFPIRYIESVSVGSSSDGWTKTDITAVSVKYPRSVDIDLNVACRAACSARIRVAGLHDDAIASSPARPPGTSASSNSNSRIRWIAVSRTPGSSFSRAAAETKIRSPSGDGIS